MQQLGRKDIGLQREFELPKPDVCTRTAHPWSTRQLQATVATLVGVAYNEAFMRRILRDFLENVPLLHHPLQVRAVICLQGTDDVRRFTVRDSFLYCQTQLLALGTFLVCRVPLPGDKPERLAPQSLVTQTLQRPGAPFVSGGP